MWTILNTCPNLGMACGLYVTNGEDTNKYVINDSRCQILFVEDAEKLGQILAIKDDLPNVKTIVQMSGSIDVNDEDVLR